MMLQPLSGLTRTQLQMLATAYKICGATPTEHQVSYLSERVQLSTAAITAWFLSRKVLQDWIQQQPGMSLSELQSMFYAPSGRETLAKR